VNIVFDDFAEEEFKDSIDYYELLVAGLGNRFKQEVIRALRNIKK